MYFCPRRVGRVVECGGLENRCLSQDRGFESLTLRRKQKALKTSAFCFIIELRNYCGKQGVSRMTLSDLCVKSPF